MRASARGEVAAPPPRDGRTRAAAGSGRQGLREAVDAVDVRVVVRERLDDADAPRRPSRAAQDALRVRLSLIASSGKPRASPTARSTSAGRDCRACARCRPRRPARFAAAAGSRPPRRAARCRRRCRRPSGARMRWSACRIGGHGHLAGRRLGRAADGGDGCRRRTRRLFGAPARGREMAAAYGRGRLRVCARALAAASRALCSVTCGLGLRADELLRRGVLGPRLCSRAPTNASRRRDVRRGGVAAEPPAAAVCGRAGGRRRRSGGGRAPAVRSGRRGRGGHQCHARPRAPARRSARPVLLEASSDVGDDCGDAAARRRR